MCGIAGMLALTGVPDIAAVADMVGALAHRGPDGAGCYRDAHVALGHARLAVIDPAGGAQPLAGEEDDVWVSFNGEIYDYRELRSALRSRGHRFRTDSDTEVIVHAWEEWGPACFGRFNGQWALALWDRRTRELVLARDGYGIHPLFHVRTADRLLFASEAGALFTDPAVDRAFDPEGLDEVFTFWSARAPRTVYRGIRQVRPGTALIVRDGAVTEHVFDEIGFPPEPEDLDRDVAASAAELRGALIEATRLRFLRSDVPVAAYLSGGLDSSVTAGIIRRHTDAEVTTYGLRFADRDYDEGGYQRLVSRHLGTDHHELTVTAGDIARAFPAAVRHAETPLLRAAPAPMHLLSRFVRDSGHRVVVTGEGADEVLAGYDIFREAAVRRFQARGPGSAGRAEALDLLYPWMPRSPAKAPAFAAAFFGRGLDLADPMLSHRPRWDGTAVLKGMLTDGYRHAGDATERLAAELPAQLAAWHPLARAQWLEMHTLLPGYLLSSQGDRMLMAHGVEGRYPFLDPHVRDVAARMPARHKLHGLDEKHVLKHAFADLVPPEVLERPKQPYRSPDAASFFTADAPAWVADALDPDAVSAAGVFRTDVVQRLTAKARRGGLLGNTDNMRMIAVLSTQLLARALVTAPAVRPAAFTTVHDMLTEERRPAWTGGSVRTH